MVLTWKCCPVSFHLCPSSDRSPRRALREHLNVTETLFYSHLPKYSVSHPSVWNKSTDNVILLLGIMGFSSGSDLNNHLIMVATVPAATAISRTGHQNLAFYAVEGNFSWGRARAGGKVLDWTTRNLECSQSLLFSSHYPLIVLKKLLPYYFALVNVLKIPSADSIWHWLRAQ